MNSKTLISCEAGVETILDQIGRTPMVRLHKVVSGKMASVYAKFEFFNPGGSVKDRICLAMIEDAEKRGLIDKHSTVIEPTSGNTGIGLAMVCASKGYKCILVMPETMSLERMFILRAYGAEVVLTPGKKGMSGAIKKAEELQKKTPHSIILHQFENRANAEIHRKTTAQEILNAIGCPDVFVAGVGTGGTITGVGEILKQHRPDVKIIAVEPENCAVLSGGKPGLHKIQGIGAGFIPVILNRDILSEVIRVSDANAFAMARRLAKEEGLLVGVSSGAAAWAALKVAQGLEKEKVVATVFPDRGDRYFSVEQYFEA